MGQVLGACLPHIIPSQSLRAQGWEVVWRVKITALMSGGLQVLQTLLLRCTGSPTNHLHRGVLQALKVRALCGTGAEHTHTMSVRSKAEPEGCVPICGKSPFCPVFLEQFSYL